MDPVHIIVTVLIGTVTLLVSFILIHYVSNNFNQLTQKASGIDTKATTLEKDLVSITGKITAITKDISLLEKSIDEIRQIINSKTFQANIEEQIRDLEKNISEINDEIQELDKHSIIRTKDLQSVSDLIKDLSHETEIRFKTADFHYASVLEDLEILKRQCEIYRVKISKIETQLSYLEKNILTHKTEQ